MDSGSARPMNPERGADRATGKGRRPGVGASDSPPASSAARDRLSRLREDVTEILSQSTWTASDGSSVEAADRDYWLNMEQLLDVAEAASEAFDQMPYDSKYPKYRAARKRLGAALDALEEGPKP